MAGEGETDDLPDGELDGAFDSESEREPRRRSRVFGRLGKVGKWTLGIVAALVLLVAGAAVLLNTPIGERFLASRIAATTLPNGLNIRIGRIEGNLYGRAVLHDVVLSDPQGQFLTIPRAEVDWNPGAWLSNRLEIDEFAARRATLTRIPEFLPSKEDGPILPGFDISVDRLEIDNLTLAAGIAGDAPQTVDLLAEMQVEDRRLMVASRGSLGSDDRFAFNIDAEPDGDVFDLGLDYRASADGALAGLLGLDEAYRARIVGDGTWTRWDGALVVRREDERFAALKITNRSGRFGLLGEIDPGGLLGGTLGSALGETVALKAEATIEDRRFDGEYALRGRALAIDAEGLIDLADNRVETLSLDARLTDPALFGDGLLIEDARLLATAGGSFDDLTIEHTLQLERLVSGDTELAGLTQRGIAIYDGSRWRLPLAATVERVATGNDLLDPRLVRGRLDGEIVLAGDRLLSDDLRIAFPNTTAALALRGDLSAGTYRVTGDVRARQLVLDQVGRTDGSARIDLTLGGATPWQMRANVAAQISPVSNDTVANLAGDPIRLRGGIRIGANIPLVFNDFSIAASRLTARLDGRVEDGRTTIAGSGRHVEYGPFTIEAALDDSGPNAVLVFADPLPAADLRDVRVAISPTDEGFRIETEGQSLLGPFDGLLGLYVPAGGPTRIDIELLTVTDTQVRGDLTLLDGGVAGDLALSGGGLDGTIALQPRGSGQGVDIALRARNARFGGTSPITIARANIEAEGLIAEGNTTFSGTARGAGLSYGTLFLGRFAAQGQLRNGVGQVDASVAGRRGGSFRLDLNAGITPERIALAARGQFAGNRISMPRRAVLTRLDDGGWQLARSQLNYGDGGLIASGRFGGGRTALDLRLAGMPLSLVDVAAGDLGLGGTISGIIEYGVGPGGLPRGTARVKVDDLTRSGLVLSSRPVDLALVGELDEDSLVARAVLQNEDIRRGRIQASITGLPRSGDLVQRLRAGRLDAQLRYQGAAESLWRLAAVDAFDLTGPVSVAADATGSLANPQVRGSMASDDLRVRSSLSGTDVRDVTARGRFSGSRLRLTRFAGSTANGGTVSGSGIVDLQGLGERVEGRFTEVRGPTLDLRASAKNARLLNANGLSATITGPLRIVSNGLGGTIAGRVRIDRASWRLGTAAEDMRLPRISTREVNRPDDVSPEATASRPWRYLINARGPSRIDVDGMGLDSEWGADIILRGTTADPRIGGEAEVVRGSYSFAGTRFEITRGLIEFDENEPIDPRLDIRAETEADGIDVEVRVGGNAQEPEVSFTSTPALPEEEILARLLFGGSITSLSATDALQLGAALASLRGGGGLDPINQLRSAIGLDRLRIVSADPALNRGTGVALGKNFGRRFYVELITDGRGYSATEVEFRVTSWLSLLASISTIGRESIVAEASRDY
ncbi:translocation/assembly module TamB domain-containing protein [Qipengyuania sp. MTN3-11]|uniref:translocation/assembly module TamB domain-containing protein n=1 Tax=Qipengyuania sp. MTN3-11 TaxID=3056557 RepID=UPI0036F35A9C